MATGPYEEKLREMMQETELEIIREAVRASLKVDKLPELKPLVKAMKDSRHD